MLVVSACATQGVRVGSEAIIREQQLFSAFAPSECALARKVVQASLEEKASDSAEVAWAESLRRLRVGVFGRDNAGWIDVDEPWQASLRAALPAIRAEVEALDDSGSWTSASYGALAPKWRFRPVWSFGAFHPEALRDLPATCAAVKASGARLHPWQELACGIARLPARAHIATHCDGGLVSWTAHLGISTPGAAAALEVGGERRSWADGQWLVFDSSWPHAARNDAESDRYVLLLQVLRADVPNDQVDALEHALSVDHPPIGRVHAGLWTPSGLHSTWRTFSPGEISLARGKPSPIAAVLATPPRDGDQHHWHFQPKQAAQPRTLPFDDAPVAPRLRGRPTKPALLGLSPHGDLDWLALPRLETPQGRFLAGAVSADPLGDHLRFLEDPGQAAAWFRFEDGNLSTRRSPRKTSRRRR